MHFALISEKSNALLIFPLSYGVFTFIKKEQLILQTPRTPFFPLITCLFDVFIFRELLEESGLTVDALEKVGNITFEFVGEAQLLDVHVFRADHYNGEPTESEGCVISTDPQCTRKIDVLLIRRTIAEARSS